MVISDLSFFKDTCETSSIFGGDYYASVATSSSSSANGYSYNYQTLEGAQLRALEECGIATGSVRDNDCEVRFSYSSPSAFTLV